MQFATDLEKEYQKNLKQETDYCPLSKRNPEVVRTLRLDGCCDHYPSKAGKKYRKCVACVFPFRTNHICLKCNVHVHGGSCWQKWHSEANYLNADESRLPGSKIKHRTSATF